MCVWNFIVRDYATGLDRIHVIPLVVFEIFDGRGCANNIIGNPPFSKARCPKNCQCQKGRFSKLFSIYCWKSFKLKQVYLIFENFLQPWWKIINFMHCVAEYCIILSNHGVGPYNYIPSDKTQWKWERGVRNFYKSDAIKGGWFQKPFLFYRL